MATQYRKGHDVPRDFMRQYKSLGNIGPAGQEVFAEVMALEALSIGGGGANVQYTEADVDASISGTAAMWEDTGDTLRAVSAVKPLPVNVVAGAAGGGIATQGARDATAQSWFVSDNGGSLTVDSPQIPAALGQNTMVNSLAVVLASNQSAIPVTGTFFQATQPVSLAAAVPVTDNAGSLTVDAPVGTPVFVRLSDGAAALVGQKAMAASLPVVIASDQGALTVSAHAVTNAGTFAVQESGAALTALQLLDDTIIADDANFVIGTTKTTVAGFLADETATDSVDEGDVGAARMTLDRKLRAVQTPHTAGGLSKHHLVSAATTNATNIKASAGQVFGWYIYNSNAAARKLVFHDTAGTPTAGAAVFFSIVIPAGAAANVEFTNGIEFPTGIGITMVTGLADADGTAVAANDLVSNIFYK